MRDRDSESSRYGAVRKREHEHDRTGEQENTENICTSMQQDKGHVNMRSVIKRSTSTSEGGPPWKFMKACLNLGIIETHGMDQNIAEWTRILCQMDLTARCMDVVVRRMNQNLAEWT